MQDAVEACRIHSKDQQRQDAGHKTTSILSLCSYEVFCDEVESI